MERSGRGLTEGTIPVYSWRDWGKPRKSSVSIAGLRAEIWTRDFPNTKQECQPLGKTSRIPRFDLIKCCAIKIEWMNKSYGIQGKID
jgi:hypothetical protein